MITTEYQAQRLLRNDDYFLAEYEIRSVGRLAIAHVSAGPLGIVYDVKEFGEVQIELPTTIRIAWLKAHLGDGGPGIPHMILRCALPVRPGVDVWLFCARAFMLPALAGFLRAMSGGDLLLTAAADPFTGQNSPLRRVIANIDIKHWRKDQAIREIRSCIEKGCALIVDIDEDRYLAKVVDEHTPRAMASRN